MTTLLGIGVVAAIVTIDNAILAGLLVPLASHDRKKSILITVGILLGASQILLAASVDQLLHNIFFRLFAIGLLGWMCIRTLGMYASRSGYDWKMVAKLWLFTVVGNLDNMFWLGSELKGERLALIAVSILSIPLFVAVALFLSDQSEKQQWILPLGAGMMAWAAADLTLDIPSIAAVIGNMDDAPRTTFQCLITICILVIGLGVRQLVRSRR